MTYYEDFTTKQQHVLQAATCISGILSIIACIFVIWTYIRFKEIRAFHFRIILFLNITDLLCSVTLVVGAVTRQWSVSGGAETEPSYALCLIIGVLVEFFQLAGILWTFCIAHTLFMVLTAKDYNPERFEIFYHILCWVVPAVFDVILLVTTSIGDSGIWCWIKADEGDQVFRFLFLYFPLFVVIVTNVILYIFTFLRLRTEKKQFTPRPSRGLYKEKAMFDSGKSDPYSVQSSFGYFTAILVVCWTFPVINGILHVTNPDDLYFGVYVMTALLLPLQGFFNAIVYGLNDEIRRKLKEEIPIFARIGKYLHRTKQCFFALSCCTCLRPKGDGSSLGISSQSRMDRKKFYDSIMSEYDEEPERRPENEEATEAILSQGSLYTSAEFDTLFKNYKKDNQFGVLDATSEPIYHSDDDCHSTRFPPLGSSDIGE